VRFDLGCGYQFDAAKLARHEWGEGAAGTRTWWHGELLMDTGYEGVMTKNRTCEDQTDIKTGQTAWMGFNPHRQYKRKRADLPIVVLALLIVGALVIWGFLG
jgi:hypothetical protein